MLENLDQRPRWRPVAIVALVTLAAWLCVP
jgi:hypothetical protein